MKTPPGNVYCGNAAHPTSRSFHNIRLEPAYRPLKRGIDWRLPIDRLQDRFLAFMNDIYDFELMTLTGEPFEIKTLSGKLMLVVNTASDCAFTPQYAGLEALHRMYQDRGLAVLGFPCNQFGGQEPGDAAAIAAFCRNVYGVSFPMFEKIEVNGASSHPLYRWLKSASGGGDVEWNFVKFLVDRDGEFIRRYPPQAAPEDLSLDIDEVI